MPLDFFGGPGIPDGAVENPFCAKLHKPTLPKLVSVPDNMAKRLGHGIMLIPTALDVDGMIRKIPRSQVSTPAQIRKRLARWHDVDVTCPLVTGILLRIVAEATEEDRLAGKSEVTLTARGWRGWPAEPEISGWNGTSGRASARGGAYRRARKGCDRGKPRAGIMRAPVVIMKIIRL